jgi:hypothetical protein
VSVCMHVCASVRLCVCVPCRRAQTRTPLNALFLSLSLSLSLSPSFSLSLSLSLSLPRRRSDSDAFPTGAHIEVFHDAPTAAGPSRAPRVSLKCGADRVEVVTEVPPSNGGVIGWGCGSPPAPAAPLDAREGRC